MKKLEYVAISPARVCVKGRVLDTQATGADLLTEVYRREVGNYAKFFKMDTLSRLGFLAAELLLKGTEKEVGEAEVPPLDETWGVVLFGRSSSLRADTHFQASIQSREEFFPSPAIFVYTLPNVTAGEISIRHKFSGETAFYVLAGRDARTLARQLMATFQDEVTEHLVAAWTDCMDDGHFEAAALVLNRDDAWDEASLAGVLEEVFALELD